MTSGAWEAVRKRPSMYIGSTGERGLHQLVFEIAGPGLSEVLAGRATQVEIALMPDGGVRVGDDGPGVPFEDTDAGRPGLETRLTRAEMGSGFGGGPRYPMFGVGGAGPFVVNALSRRMTVEVRREGVRRVQEYAGSVAAAPPADAGPVASTGTTITFWPDADILEVTEYSFDALAEQFGERAFLNRQLDISLKDDRPSEPRSARFRSPGGARDMVASLDEQAVPAADPDIIGFEQEDSRMAGMMEVAMRWRDSGPERVRSFANSSPTTSDSNHVAGFYDGVQTAVNTYARERRLLPETAPDLGVDQIGEGLAAVVSVKLEHPEFKGATRSVLRNADVRACVRQAVLEHLGSWLGEHPQQAAAVVDRIIQRACLD